MGNLLGSACILSAVFCVAFSPVTVVAQAYPSKPIRLIMPASPGSGADTNVRLVVNELSQQLGRPVVVDNRGGADGIIGFEALARAAPDGYTLGLLTTAFLINPSMYAKLPYDGTRDFLPVVQQARSTFLLTVTPSLPIGSVKDLIEYARKNPGKLLYGGEVVHSLPLELLKVRTDTNIVGVRYKAIQQAVTDAIGGQIHLVFENMSSVLPHVRSGKLRGLGVSTINRAKAAPDIPTLDEAGIAGYDASFPGGYAVPAGVSREIVLRLNAEINKALKSRNVIERFEATGVVVGGGTPEQFAELIRSETAKWAKSSKRPASRLSKPPPDMAISVRIIYW